MYTSKQNPTFISFTEIENNNFAVKYSDMVIAVHDHFPLNQRPHMKNNLKGTRPLFKKIYTICKY